MGLSFTIAAGPRQRIHSQVRVPRDTWPHFTGILHPLTLARKTVFCNHLMTPSVSRLYGVDVRMISEYLSSWWNENLQVRPKSLRRKLSLSAICLPQIPPGLTWDRTRAVAVASRQLTARAVALEEQTLNTEKSLIKRAGTRKSNSFQNGRTEFRTKVNLNRE
jgi:hypothetical protein